MRAKADDRQPDAGPAAGDAALLSGLLERTSRTFALTIPLLPEPTRRQVTVAYLLFRIADTFEDAERWDREGRLTALAEIEGLLRRPDEGEVARRAARWLADPPCRHAGYLELLAAAADVFRMLAALPLRARASIARHSRRTARAMGSFVARGRGDGRLELEDLADLRAYCYAVAGIVGEMLTELFVAGWRRARPPARRLRERAAAFGEGLQLVNILRDADADTRAGRRYLPAGVAPGEIFTLARRGLQRGEEYVLALHEAGADRGLVAFTALPVLLARPTLDRVEAEGPGARLGRHEVLAIYGRLESALDAGRPPF